ncbi:MAG: thiamine biosynthesis protein ThiF [Actinomycetes bacterium]
MLLRLRPGLYQAWRRPGRLQIGLDARHGVVLDGLEAADERLVTALAEGTTLPRLLRLAARLQVPEQRVHDLLAELRAARALAAPPTVRSRLARLPDVSRRRLAPDATVLGVAHPDGDGWHVLAARRTRCVGVVGAGRTGLAVATGVAAAGVGCVLVDDASPVRAGDVAPGGYTGEDVGRPRDVAARDVLARCCPDTRTAARGRVRPDVLVLVGHGVLDPSRADALLREDVAHLAVTWGEAGVVVGPFVVPGRSSCLRCQHLHRTDRDPEWPRLVAQLVGRRAVDVPPAEEGSLAALAAALATVQVLTHLDGGVVPATDATLEVGLPEAAIAVRAWPAHPRCGCVRLPGVAGSAGTATMRT